MNADVFELMQAAAPDVAAAMKGVPEDELLAVEEGLGVHFPAAYRSYMRCMGESTASFSFGTSTQTTRLLDLLAELEPPEQRVSRYWRVSVERDLYQPVPVDYYLDLATSDGEDADLVGFCDPPENAQEEPFDDRESFFDYVRIRVFYQLVCPIEREYWGSISVRRGADIQQVDAAVRRVLEHEGFAEFAPYRHERALFSRGDCCVSIRHKRDRSISSSFISVSATTREQAGLLVEKLRDHIPASVSTNLRGPR